MVGPSPRMQTPSRRAATQLLAGWGEITLDLAKLQSASAPRGQGMLAAFGCGLWVGVAARLRVVKAVSEVEHGPLGVDLGEVVEVVVRWG
jgi:hypothetical protein